MTRILEHHHRFLNVLFAWLFYGGMFVGFCVLVSAITGHEKKKRVVAKTEEAQMEVLIKGYNRTDSEWEVPAYMRDRRTGLCYAYSGREIRAAVPCDAVLKEKRGKP